MTRYGTIALSGVVALVHASAWYWELPGRFWIFVICSYVQFTAMHDACHGSISDKAWINQAMGWLAQLWMGPLSNFYGEKYTHLIHHKYVNQPDKDPDHYVSGKWWTVPFRCLTIDINYWRFYIPLIIPWNPKRPLIEILVTWTYHACMCALIAYSYYLGYFNVLLWNWILPSRVAIGILAFMFAFIPHYPHKNPARYENTHNIDFGIFNSVMGLLMMWQNFHGVHHANPNISFWDYVTYWRHNEEKLKDRGLKVVKARSWFSLDPVYKVIIQWSG